MRRGCSIGSSALAIVQKIRVPAIVIMLCSMFVAYGQAGRKGEIAIAFGNVLIGLSLWISSRRVGALALSASGAGVVGSLSMLVMGKEPGTFAIGAAVCAGAFSIAARNTPIVSWWRVKSWLARAAVYVPMAMIACFTCLAVTGNDGAGLSIAAGSSCVALALAVKSPFTRALAVVAPLALIARVLPQVFGGVEPGVYMIAVAACSVGAVIALNASFFTDSVRQGRTQQMLRHLNPTHRESLKVYKPFFALLSPAVLAFCLVSMAHGTQSVFMAIAGSGGVVATAIISLRFTQQHRDWVLLGLLGAMGLSVSFAHGQHDPNIALNLLFGGSVGISIIASEGRHAASRGIVSRITAGIVSAFPFVFGIMLAAAAASFALTVTHVISFALAALLIMHLPISFTNVLLGLRGGGSSPWSANDTADGAGRWSVLQSNQWFERQGWLVGANFTPASAVNQLEMWQAESFDPERIEKELSWARDFGMNTMRVFLHDLLWQQDAAGFTARIEQFLTICSRHDIRPMFVLFDSCWSPFPAVGRQKPPTPGVHNSGWVQGPGSAALKDRKQHARLQQYVQGVIGAFAADERVLAWDVWNEPNNDNAASYGALEVAEKQKLVGALLAQVFGWARAAHPSQPLTSGFWDGSWWVGLTEIQRIQLQNSDVLSFHNYGEPDDFNQRVEWLESFGRPLLCTEFMARGTGSTLAAVLPIAKQRRIGMFTWGLVAGKTQTYVPWDSWQSPYQGEPPVWFHDLLHGDGTPYRADEIELLRAMTASRQL